MNAITLRKVLYAAGIVIGPDRIARYKDGDPATQDVEYFGIIDRFTALNIDGKMISLQNIVGATMSQVSRTLELAYKGAQTELLVPGTFPDSMRVQFMDPSSAMEDAKPVYKMPKTLSELNDLFPILFPDYNNKMYYDVMRERERIDMSLFLPDAIPGEFTDFSEETEYIYYDALERRLRLLGCEGTPPNIQVRYMALISKFYENKRNLFKEWIIGLKWDGIPRIDTWFQRVFNATAPPLEAKCLSDIYLAKVSRAWFMGAMYRMDGAAVHEVIPVLIGGQGNGKTSGLRYTAAHPDWFIDTTVDASTPHGKAQFLDSVRGRIVVELAEGTQLRGKDHELFKAFISMKEDQYRKPYLKRDGTYPRHFIMAASSNIDELLTDLTGNRRFYPIYCHRADLSLRTQYDVEQVWAEAYVLFQAGEKQYISADWQPAVIMQNYATAENSNVASIDNWLDNPETEKGKYAFIGAKVTKEEIFAYKFGVGDNMLPTPAFEQAWKAWTRGTRNWVRMDYPIKSPITHKSTRGYVRVAFSDIMEDEMELRTTPGMELRDLYIQTAEFAKGMEPDFGRVLDDSPFRNMTLDEVFRTICITYNIHNEYEEFPILGLSTRTVLGMQDAGLIYYDRTKGAYRVVSAIGDLGAKE